MKWSVIMLGLMIILSAAQPGLLAADPLTEVRALCEAAGKEGRWLAPGELREALMDVVGGAAAAEVREAIAKVGDRRYCFGIALTSPGQQPLMLIGPSQEMKTGAILWQDNGVWQVSASPEAIVNPRILRISAAWGGNEVILVDEGHGSGQFGNVLVLRRVNSTWVTAFKTPTVSRFRAHAPDDDHILVTGGGGGPRGAPLAWTGNCCLPSNHQVLYRRKEPSFILAQEREVPDPYTTLNIFFGALRADQPEYAAYWLGEVATRGAVLQARQIGLDQAGLAAGAAQVLQEIFREEERHWRALPPNLNGPAPSPSTIKVLVTPPCSEIAMERQAAGWRVVSVRTAESDAACPRTVGSAPRGRSETSFAARPSDARRYRN